MVAERGKVNLMKKVLIKILLFIALAAALPVVNAKKLFEANFDDKSPNQLFKKTQLTDGILGKGALVSPSTPLAYESIGKIDPNLGTLSFWIKPIDWSGMTKGTYFPIFWHGAKRCRGAYSYLILTTKSTLPSFEMTSKRTNKDVTARCFLIGAMKNKFFTKGKWTNVTVTWDTWQFHIFLDGKEYATGGYNHPIDRVKAVRDFKLWFGNSQFWGNNLKYSSVFDNIVIYDEMLEANKIQALYEQGMPYVPKNKIRHRMPVPASANRITIDGKLDAHEWNNATKFPLNKRFFKGIAINEPAWGMIQYDQDNIYVAAGIDINGKFITPGNGFDRRVFKGDNFEITLRSPRFKEDDKPFFQLAVGPNGSWILNNFGNWNKNNMVKTAVEIKNGWWFTEIMIPRKILPETFKTGDVWLAQFGFHIPSDKRLVSRQDAILSWTHGYDSYPGRYMLQYSTPHVMGDLYFGTANDAVRIDSIGQLGIGNLNLLETSGNKQDFMVEIFGENGSLFKKTEQKVSKFKAKCHLTTKEHAVLNIFAGNGEKNNFAYQTILDIRDSLYVKPVFYPSRNIIKIDVTANMLPPTWQKEIISRGLTAQVTLRKKGDKDRLVIAKKRFRMDKIKKNIVLTFDKLEYCNYELIVKIIRNKQEISSFFVFERPNDEFLSKKNAVSIKTVPAPWTPIEMKNNNEFSIWGRRYVFGTSGFPESMDSQGERILTAPVSLELISKGQKYTFTELFSPIRTVKKSGLRIVQSGKSSTPGNRFILSWKRTIEFDGMIYYEISLSSIEPRLEIDALTLKFRVAAGSSRYLQMPRFSRDWSEKNAVAYKHTNYYWLTGIKTGLDFFTPDDGNWVYDKKPMSFFRRNKDADAVVTAKIIDHGITTYKALSYRFGFIATPVRPLRKDWRKFNTQAWGYAKNQNWQYHLGYNDKKELLQFPNIILLTDVSDPVKARKDIRRWHRKNINIVPFSGMNFMPDNNPFYDYYATDWRTTLNGRPTGKSYGSHWQGKEFHMCCPVCPASTYPDFLRWCTVNLMKKYGFNGLYLDGGQALQCDNHLHGCGFTDAFGRKIKTWNDLHLRKAYLDLHTAIHQVNPQAILWVHAAEKNAPHIHGFVDLLFPGEDIMPDVPGNPRAYTDTVPLEQWQSSYFIQHTLGVAATFLGMSQKVFDSIVTPPTDPNISTPLLAMCLVHDAHLFGNFIYCKTIEKYWDIESANGMTSPDVIFTGYWFPQPKITSTNPRVLVSYYTWPDNDSCVIIVANPDSKEQKYYLKFNGKFSSQKDSSVELWSNSKVDLNHELTIPNRSFAIFKIK